MANTEFDGRDMDARYAGAIVARRNQRSGVRYDVPHTDRQIGQKRVTSLELQMKVFATTHWLCVIEVKRPTLRLSMLCRQSALGLPDRRQEGELRATVLASMAHGQLAVS